MAAALGRTSAVTLRPPLMSAPPPLLLPPPAELPKILNRGTMREPPLPLLLCQGCQMAKFDPFLSLDCAGMEGGLGAQSKERKGSNFAAQRSGAIVLHAQRAKRLQS